MPISRQEVDSILNVQREVLQTSREVKLLVQHTQSGQPPAAVAPGGSQDASNQQMSVLQQILGEIRENMNVVRREFGGITTRLVGISGGGPQAQASTSAQCASCVSTTALAVLLGFHLIIVVGFMIYQSNKADKQKKFY